LDGVTHAVSFSSFQGVRRQWLILLYSQLVIRAQADPAPAPLELKFPWRIGRARSDGPSSSQQAGVRQQVGVRILPYPFHPAPIDAEKGGGDGLVLEDAALDPVATQIPPVRDHVAAA